MKKRGAENRPPFLIQYNSGLFLLNKRDKPKQYYGTNNCCYKRSYNRTTPTDSQPAKNIAAQETAYDTNQQIDPKTKTATLHDLASQIAGQATNKNWKNNTHNKTIKD